MKIRNFAVLALIFIFAITGCSKSNAQSGSSSGGRASPATDFSYQLTEDGTGIIITNYTGKGGKVVIPATIENYPVKEIGHRTFHGTEASENRKKEKDFKPSNKDLITSIVIPDSVVSINNEINSERAFAYLDELTQVTFGNGLKVIGEGAFQSCRKLTDVNLPSSVVVIGGSAFEGCKRLTKVNLPSNLEKINWSAFEDCGELTELIIPSSLTKIEFNGGEITFKGCGKLPLATRQRLKDLGYGGVF